MREAQLILAEHIERRPRDPEETITLMLDILDRQDLSSLRPTAPVPRLWVAADKIAPPRQ